MSCLKFMKRKSNRELVDKLPKTDTILTSNQGFNYKLTRLLGNSENGVVYEAMRDDNIKCALKAELYESTALAVELKVLRAVNAKQHRHFVELLDLGRHSKDFVYIIMTLVGANLYDLRQQQPGRRFSLSTAIRVAMQMLIAIEELHNCSYISRDIKPSNFAIGLAEDQKQRLVHMLDFGLAREYRDLEGRVKPSRGEIGFRGTPRYASLASHTKMDLGRKDDLESWLYSIVECRAGRLPWRDQLKICSMKLAARYGDDRQRLLTGCPEQFDHILTSIDALNFTSEPDYNQMFSQLKQVLKLVGLKMTGPYDWEEKGSETLPANSERSTITAKSGCAASKNAAD